jgi:membrane-bound metal-dependent hydrolase YbcI (DUF457 family)
MNGATHKLVAGVAVGSYLAGIESRSDRPTPFPLVGGAAAAFLTGLPDILEPATSPNHRAFFHSLAVVGLISVGMHKIYQWEPKTAGDDVLRRLLLLGGAAYLIHLALDFTTKKSLPLI